MCCPLTFNRIHCFLLGLQESVDNCRDNNAPSDRFTTNNEWGSDAKGNGTGTVRRVPFRYMHNSDQSKD